MASENNVIVLTIIYFSYFQCLVSCQADINVTDYVFWTKDGIYQWHQFFPTRILKEETLTIEIAEHSLLPYISYDLKKILTFQYQELETARQVMDGTDAEGCIKGISSFLDQAVQEGELLYSCFEYLYRAGT